MSQSQEKIWWKPTSQDTFFIQLQGTPKEISWAVVYDVDLVDTPKDWIIKQKAKGKKVVCYFSAGSYEDWRPDAKLFPKKALGKDLDGWEGERWIDVRSKGVRTILKQRLDLAAAKGCDGVDPDNVDGYTNNTGFNLTQKDSTDFNLFVAKEAHLRGLAVGLKNGMGMLPALAPSFDFAVNEQCHEYEECDTYRDFVKTGKPVFNLEYRAKYVKNTRKAFDKMCATSKKLGIASYVYPLLLDGKFVHSCNKRLYEKIQE